MAAMAARAIWKGSISFGLYLLLLLWIIVLTRVEIVISIIMIHAPRMPRYVILVNWTDQGIRTAKDAPKRVEDFKNAVERSGGKMVDGYYTMGQYDFVITVELPNDETAMSLMLATGIRGNVRTTTLKAFSISEAEKIITKLS